MDIISTRQVAELLAVSEATVKRWADAQTIRCFRTPGGHRKFRMGDIADFLRDHHYEAAGPLPQVADRHVLAASPRIDGTPAPQSATSVIGDDALLALARPGTDGARGTNGHASGQPHGSNGNGSGATLPSDGTLQNEPDVAVRFRNLALSGDVDGLVSLIAQQRLRGHTLSAIFDGVATPAMTDIGERWARGVLTVSQEHMASSAVVEALARIRPLIEKPSVERGKIVLGCPGDELHDIAVRMAALLAYGAGFQPLLTGSRTPAYDLGLLVAGERPRAVVLSASQAALPDALERDLAVIVQAAQSAGSTVIVGGAGFMRLETLPPGVVRSTSLTDLAAAMVNAAGVAR